MSIEEVAEQHVPLRISWRAQRPDHSIHLVLADILEAAGCPTHRIESWGGRVFHDDGLFPHRLRAGELSRCGRAEAGERDAVFDEGVPGWWTYAVNAGMQLLALRPETMEKLSRVGYRSSTITQADHPGLHDDVQAIDFSGWAVFTHADAPDAMIRAFCDGIERNAARIPWEADTVEMSPGEGPFPLAHVLRRPENAPLDVPYHPAAEQYWQERGYLD